MLSCKEVVLVAALRIVVGHDLVEERLLGFAASVTTTPLLGERRLGCIEDSMPPVGSRSVEAGYDWLAARQRGVASSGPRRRDSAFRRVRRTRELSLQPLSMQSFPKPLTHRSSRLADILVSRS